MKNSSFLAWILRMNLIKRWSPMHLMKEENVAEHSHQVAVIAHLLATIKNVYCGGQISPEKAATIALYHEVSETKLQDINHVTKYSSPALTEEFKKIEDLAEIECLNTLPEKLQPLFKELVIQKQVDKEYKKLVKAADVLTAYFKACDELKFHNPEFVSVKKRLSEKVDAYKEEMPEVGVFMDLFEQNCLASLDDLSS
ncbi:MULTISPECIES: 5'-deoxynucleotidase [unclassified Pseudoalteromonas]|uniref:5'-deoxynucleotidase n=1 Tax=Alteromonadales TaxID=135622 RepID=UPI001020C59F|nr:5'-deoxynucleotidase [Pseudoalteromonas sp. MEBiC 03485]RZD23003.1 5'-deoxynucleotidase [Pseudoalteromonas sp. MEBiC 03485]